MTDTTSITVTRSIDASTAELFSVLTNPARHADFDGSGFVRSADHPQRVTAVGDKFRMNMSGPHMGGDYQTDNLVTGLQDNKLIAWKTAPAGEEPPGWEWMYELKATDGANTDVTLTYDWSSVTDQNLLKKISFPLVSQSDLEKSLDQLAAAVRA